MKIKIALTGLILVAMVSTAQSQDSTKAKVFDYSKLTPIVHFFANSEYNQSEGNLKDYSFWIGRMMFGFKYQFDKKWSGKVLIDRTRLSGSMNSMYVKVANLRWAPNDRFAIECGATNQTSFIPFETFYGYRFVAETFQDRYYGITSSDLGVIAYYRISKMFSVDAAVTNGEGPRIDQDAFGKIRLAGGLNFFPTPGIQTRVYYQVKSSGEPGRTAKEQLFNGYAGYQAGPNFRIGAEFNYMSGFMNIPGYTSYGGTFFGCVRLYKTLQFMARFDRLIVKDTGESVNPYALRSGNALITGFSLSPLKGITLCLNYQGSFRVDNFEPSGHRVLFSFEYRI